MIDVDLSPAPPPAPSPPAGAPRTVTLPRLSAVAPWLATAAMAAFLVYGQFKAPAPAVSTFTASFAAYRAAQPNALVAVGKAIQAGTLDTAAKVDAELASRSAPMAAAVKSVVSAHCDKDTGKVTDPAGLGAEFVAAGTAAGGK